MFKQYSVYFLFYFNSSLHQVIEESMSLFHLISYRKCSVFLLLIFPPTLPSSLLLSADRRGFSHHRGQPNWKRSIRADTVEPSPQKDLSACLPPALQRLGAIIIMAYENFTWNSAFSETSPGRVIAPSALFISPDKACLMPLNVLVGIKRGSPNGNLLTAVLWCYRFAHVVAPWEQDERLRISAAHSVSNPRYCIKLPSSPCHQDPYILVR